jgi:alkylated DNA repair dioxygenase AlkB
MPREILLTDVDGELRLYEQFLSRDEATQWFASLRSTLPWHEEHVTMFGKSVTAPRLISWHGDAGAVYTYSGVRHDPAPWTPDLLALRHRIEGVTQRRFNSVLANLYRDGRDSMGWHADKEKELGDAPFIASLSLGAERLFRVRHNRSGKTLDVVLRNGDLLTMGGVFQKHWRHCVPKSAATSDARINLTFRHIVPA